MMFRYETSETLRTYSKILEVIESDQFMWHCSEDLSNLNDDTFDELICNVAEVIGIHNLGTYNDGLISYLIGAELLRILHDNDPKSMKLSINGCDKETGIVMQTHFYHVKPGRSCDRLNNIINAMADDDLNIHIMEV